MKNLKKCPLIISCLIILLSGCITPPQDESPIASIVTDDTTLYVGNYCVLNASGSDAGSGDTLIYNWEQGDSNPIPIDIFELMHEKKKAIGFCKEGTYKFKLTVNNGIQDSKGYEIVINVLPREIIQFEDPTLEVRVRHALDIPIGILSDSALLKLDSLDKFIFTGENLFSLNGLEKCPNLELLQIGQENISDISPLSTLYKLKKLILLQTWDISDISALTNLTNLEYLEIQCNNVNDISPLANLTKLKYLNILENPVRDCTPLSNLINLKELWLSEATGVNLSFVSQMDSLNFLWATASNISDISPISDRINLKILNLSYNQISDISHLSALSNLVTVYLKSNQISDITALQYMTKIEKYKLQNNLIENIEPLVNNNGLGEGDVLTIYGNPLDSISINEYIPALIERGVYIRH
jgi:Leucine-rich repeat (LRR) protein